MFKWLVPDVKALAKPVSGGCVAITG